MGDEFSPGLDPWSVPVPDSGLAVDVTLEIEIEKPLEVVPVWATAVADDPPPYRVALTPPSGPPTDSPIPPRTRATPAADETPVLVSPAAPARRRPSIRRLAPLVAVVAGLILIGVAVLPH